jgi:NADH-quinone oxidoreductase subunit H
LVSGFNTEYSGAYFAFIFLSEYGVLLFSCFLITYIFFRVFLPTSALLYTIIALFVSFFFIWVRITFCRFRYDMLIIMSWKVLLPFRLWSFIILICTLF